MFRGCPSPGVSPSVVEENPDITHVKPPACISAASACSIHRWAALVGSFLGAPDPDAIRPAIERATIKRRRPVSNRSPRTIAIWEKFTGFGPMQAGKHYAYHWFRSVGRQPPTQHHTTKHNTTRHHTTRHPKSHDTMRKHSTEFGQAAMIAFPHLLSVDELTGQVKVLHNHAACIAQDS